MYQTKVHFLGILIYIVHLSVQYEVKDALFAFNLFQ